MKYSEYYNEVRETAQNIIDEALESQDWFDLRYGKDPYEAAIEVIQDWALPQAIDGHQWIIYTGYHLDILNNSGNDEAYTEIYSDEDIGQIIRENGAAHFDMIRAFWAFNYDVQEVIFDMLQDEIEERAAS